MDVLRAALGERKLDLLRRLLRHQARARRTPSSSPTRSAGWCSTARSTRRSARASSALEQAAGFETALRAYVAELRRRDGDCFLGDSVDEGLASDQRPSSTRSTQRAAADRATAASSRSATPSTASSRRSTTATTGTCSARPSQPALDGDGTTLLQLSDLYASRGADGGYTDNSAEAIYAINCLDDPYAIPPREVRPQLADFEKASPTFGAVFAWSLTSCGGVAGRRRPRSPRDDPRRRVPRRSWSSAPPATRPRRTSGPWRLADQLDSGVLVTPRRRRPHRLQRRQRVRRRGGRGLPRRRHRARGRLSLLRDRRSASTSAAVASPERTAPSM